jgi:hypothetical protein
MRLTESLQGQSSLISYAPNGDVLIPPQWTGYYSHLPFHAADFEDGILMTLWLDKAATIPLHAYCTDAGGFLDTATALDICLAFAQGKNMTNQGIDLAQHSLAMGHLIRVLEDGAAQDLTRLLSPTLAKKTKSTYKRLAKTLRTLLGTSTTLPKHVLVPQDTLVRLH